MIAYLDASAVVKLFKPEAESERLTEALAGFKLWTASELVTVEASCAARKAGGAPLVAVAESILDRVELIPCTSAVRERAGAGFARPLRALHAIHAASALAVRDQIAAVVVYDADLGAVLADEGLTVAAPGL